MALAMALMGQVQAQDLPITAAGPAGVRPILDAAANGVPIVHIAPPSVGGVSHNQFKEFNVNKNGLILNNSNSNVQTQLGGWITANPQLGITPARIILNEVVGTNASQLRGTMEVAGRRADIVIANPNGLLCDACGFINTNRVTLTTGTPQFEQGRLHALNVSQGVLTIGQSGLNGSQLSQLDLLARGLVLEGEVWAQNLNSITGANQILYGTLQTNGLAGTGGVPRFAVDIKSLGGMYANQVYLLATEQGLGVNSTGRIAALAGNLQLSSQGEITLKDSYAKQNLSIKSSDGMSLTGQTQSEAGMTIEAAGKLNQLGTLSAIGSGDLKLHAVSLNNTGLIIQQGNGLLNLDVEKDAINSGSLYSAANINFNAGQWSDQGGVWQAQGKLNLNAGQINLADTQLMSAIGSQLKATSFKAERAIINSQAVLDIAVVGELASIASQWQSNTAININAGDVLIDQGQIISQGELNLSAQHLKTSQAKIVSKGVLTAQIIDSASIAGGDWLSEKKLVLNAGKIENSGHLQALEVALTSAGVLNNNGGFIQSQQQLDVISQTLSNQSGSLLAGQNVQLITGALDNSQGKIASTAGKTDIQSAALINNKGLISSATGTIISSHSLSNQAGEISSAADLNLATHGQKLSNISGAILAQGKMTLDAGVIDNAQGRMLAQQNIQLNSQALSNTQGTIASVDAALNIDTHGQSLSNQDGKLQAKLALDIQSGQLDNHGVMAGQTLAISSSNADNSHGQLIAQDTLKVQTGALISDAGLIQSGGSAQLDVSKLSNTHSTKEGGVIVGGKLAINASELDNGQGLIHSNQAQTLHVGQLSNIDGQLQSQLALDIQADAINNQGGRIQAADLVVQVHAALDNSKGLIQSQQQLDLHSQSLTNLGGSLLAGQQLQLHTGALDNSQGKIASTAGKTDIQSAALINNKGLISSATGTIISSQSLSNQAGEISSAADLNLATHGQKLSNIGGAILAQGKMTLDAGVIDNAQGRMLAQQNIQLNSQALSNTQGTIASVDAALNIDTHGQSLSNQDGKLQAKLALDIQSGQLDNHGVVAGQTLAISSSNTDNSQGQLIAQDTLKVQTGALISDAGLIQSGGNAQLDVQMLANTHSGNEGGVIVGGMLTVNADNLDNHSGLIHSSLAQTINVQQLSNQDGQLQSQSALTLHAQKIDNQAGHIQAATLVIKTPTQLDNRKGTLQGMQTLQIESQQLLNQGGSVLSGQDLTLNAEVFDNTQGKIASTAGKVALNTAALSNDNGLISSATGTSISSQAMSNKGGEISSAANLSVDTHGQALNNTAGSILAQGKMQLDIAALDNAQGRILAQQNLQLNSQEISNTQGTIASVEGAMRIDTHDQSLSNQDGKLQAKQALELDSGKLDNHGLLAGQILAINSRHIDNSQGQLIAQGALSIKTGDLISDAGLIQAGGNAQLDVGKLQNTHSTKDGGVNVGGALNVNAIALDNSSGQIYSKAAQTLNASHINNQSGQLQSQAALTINADDLSNQSGQVQAAALTIKTNNGLDNSKGSIQSQQQLDISSQSLSNQGGSLLAGQTLNLQTGALNNSQGKIASTAGQTNLSSAALNNDAGLISSATGTQISSQALSNKAGEINSAADLNIDTHGQVFSNGGAVLANGKMQLASGALDNADGRILAQQDLHIRSQALSSSGTIASVEGNASIDTHGQALNNTGKLQAKLALDIQSGQLDNHGLVAGQNIGLNAANIDNSRGQLIAQDALKINAGLLISDAGLIQAGKAAQLDVAKLQNTHSAADGGLISGGTLTVNTGELDNSSGQIYSKAAQTLNASHINNQSGQLQSQAALTINADDLSNQSGQVQAAALILTAKNNIDNSKGSIQSQQQLDISSQSLSNQGGSLLAGKNVSLQTGALDNSQGKIASTAGQTNLTSAALNNDAGLISSATGTQISSQALSNKAGEINSAADLAIDTHGQAFSNGGAVLANGKMQLASGALDNADGRILAQQDLHISSQALSSSGTIASVEGNASVDTHGQTLSNTGKLQAKLALDIQSGQLDNHGLLAGQNIGLNAANIDNSRGQLIAQDALKINAGNFISDAGLIQAGKAAQLDVAKLQNTHSAADGGLISGGTLTVNTGELDNSSGQIYSKAAQTLNASHINNQSGQLQSQAALTINADDLSNQSGQIQAAALELKAKNGLDNSKGSIQSQQQLDVSSQSLSNQGGSVLAGQALNLQTGALNNSQGKIASTAGQTAITSADLNNQSGLISSAAGTELMSQTIKNDGGEISSEASLAINTQGHALSNTGGSLLAKNGSLNVSSAALDNSNGRILAKDQLTLIAHGLLNSGGVIASTTGDVDLSSHDLNNQHGKIQADAGILKIQTGTVNNSQTGILAAKNIQLNMADLDNSQGQIIAVESISANTGRVLNQSGLIQAGSNININTQGHDFINTQSHFDQSDLRGKQGLIAGGNLQLDAASLVNTAGYIFSGQSQNINLSGDFNNSSGLLESKSALNIKAQSLNNTQGALTALGDADIVLSGVFANQGKLNIGGKATIKASALDNKNGRIDAANMVLAVTQFNNGKGVVETSAGANINSNSLDNLEGSIAVGTDLSLTINGDYIHQGVLQAKGDLALSSAHLLNQGKLISDHQTTITASNLDNRGEISSLESTRINVSGQLDNHGDGLIDGSAVRIDAGTINNTSRIYGDKLSIGSQTINNRDTGVIAARADLQLGAGTLNNLNTTGNQDGALIFSLGNAAIAGGLDAVGNAQGQMSVLNNESSRIDIANNLLISANTVENKNIYLDIKQKTTTEKVALNQIEFFDGTGQRYDAGEFKYREQERYRTGQYDYYTGRQGLVKSSLVYPELVFGHTGYALPYYVPAQTGGGGSAGSGGSSRPVEQLKYDDSSPIWAKFGLIDVKSRNQGELFNRLMAFNNDLDSRTYGSWNTYRFDSKTITQSTVEKSAPGKIIAGGNMTLHGSAINNQDSALVAGGLLLGDVKNINNVSKQQGTRTEELKGSVGVNGGNWQALTLPPQTVSIPLMTVTYEGVSGAGVVKDKLGLVDAGKHAADKLASSATSQQQNGQVTDAARQQANQAQMADISQAQLSGVSAATLVQQSSAQMQQAEQATLGGARGPTKSDVEQAQMAKATLTGLIKESNAPSAKQLAAMGPVSGQSADLLADKQQVQATVDQAQMSDTAKVQLKDAQDTKMAKTSALAGPKVQSTQLGQQGRVLTMLPNLIAPNNSLFKLHTAPNQRYLVETDPRFTNQRSFLSSDYFSQDLAKDPSQQLKRYGDGFFEQKLINDQILALTGRRFLSDYRDTESEFKSLMDAGISFAKQYQLTPGVALSAEQMALLTTDLVWLTTQTVTLADGSKQDVLVPQVYLRRLEQGDLQLGGAVISAREVHLSSSEDLVNRNSSIVGNKLTLNAGRDVFNDHGQIGGQQVFIHANNDLQNQSGQIVGMGEGSKLSLSAGRDIVLQTLAMVETTNAAGTAKQSNLDRQATVQGGEISLSAGRDLLLKAASVQAAQDLSMQAVGKIDSQSIATSSSLHLATDGDWAGGRTGYLDKQSTQQNISSISAGGKALVVAGDRLSLVGTNVHAGQDLTLQGASVQIEAVKERLAGDDQRAGNDKYDRHAFSKESLQGGSVTAGQNLSIKAVGPDGNISLEGADLLAEKGLLSLAAKKDIELASIDLTQTDTQETYRHSRGWFSSKTTTTYDFSRTTQAVGNSLSGNKIDLQAGKDIKVNGSAIAATQDVLLQAGNDVKITAGTNSSKDIHDKKESKSGLFSGGGFGFTYGKQEQQTHTDADGSIQSQNRSLVGSEQGKLTIQAGNAVQVTGSDLSALAGDMVIQGKQVTVDPGQDRHQSTETQTFKQSGITVAFSAPVLSVLQAAQTVAESAKTAGESKDSRVKALSVGTAALAAKNGIDAAKAAAADPKSVSVSITYGESKSESVTQTSSISHSGSTLNAGGDIQISAVGDKASQLNVLGSEINAKGNIKLKSDGDINLQSALDESEQHSKNSSSSWGAGVAITFGQGGASYGVTANGSLSRGNADGKDTAQQNSHINAGKTLTLDSGNDTRIEGAVVSGSKIIADIGGDLKLASRQDTSQFDSKQSSVSASVTVGVGVSGSASISQDKMKSDYAAVQEQSGLFAGKDGFEIKVKNNTDLNGAVIASKSDDNSLSTGTLTQKEINNHAEYSASSIGIGGGFSMGGTEKKPEDGKAPAGDQTAAPSGSKLYDAGPSGVTATMPVALSAGDNGTSTTKSAIATAKITITDEAKQKELTGKTAAETIASLSRDTDGAQQNLANDFKPEKINELFSATKTFLQEGNTFMANRTAEADAAKAEYEQAKKQGASESVLNQLAAIKTEADKWTPGGDYGRAMTALQAAVGGNVSGGVTGLVQNASVAYLQSIGAEKIKDIADSFQTQKGEENQTSQNVRAALHAIASCAGAAASASNCSSAAVGAASSVVINNVLSEIENTNADKMTASEKEKRKNLVGSIITGIVAATDGNAAAANNAAQIEMENNYLTDTQTIKFARELAACVKAANPKACAEPVIKAYESLESDQHSKLLAVCTDPSSKACRSKVGLAQKGDEVLMTKADFDDVGGEVGKESPQYFCGSAKWCLDALNRMDSKNDRDSNQILNDKGIQKREADSARHRWQSVFPWVKVVSDEQALALDQSMAGVVAVGLFGSIKSVTSFSRDAIQSRLPQGYKIDDNGMITGPQNGKYLPTGSSDANGHPIFELSTGGYYTLTSGKSTKVDNPNPNYHRQSELDTGKDLPANAKPQQAFKDGKPVPPNTLGSVKPDWVDGGMSSWSVEVKNYNLSRPNGAADLVANISQQALDRKTHLPKGMEQSVVIDIRGQSVTVKQRIEIQKSIEIKTNGVIKAASVRFM
ncbi:hemagglutinin repeat-containing protein [Iodobacter sp. CM08]|uniref:hemagglutinin repeat-containing protein n=1 Tax=Iodobacter sp. CM08 TaxID=3085902 RepID=UPI0029829FD8|nr:hemagglutinin repeat-containing protein [Iodobacter sp. CM08]MDW5415713.1 hemagglutinin repeat-containing protein [Iodobacter sp. CM08]